MIRCQVPFIARRAVLALCCGAVLSASPFAAEGPFDEALQQYERNHWPQAFAALSRLADGGDAEAARMAALMWRHGPRLYGVAFQARPDQLERWQNLASQAPAATVADLTTTPPGR